MRFLKHLKFRLLPNACILCGGFPEREIDLCEPCEKDLPWLKQACSVCAQSIPSASQTEQICGVCLKKSPPFTKTIALFSYQFPIAEIIAGVKFQRKLVYARLLGKLLAKKLIKEYHGKSWPQCIIPMPLYQTRLRERGFNQAVEIARPIVKEFGLTMDVRRCYRNRATRAQAELPASERHANVKDAFAIKKKIDDSHVAILDDVVTTGNTVIELSRTLKKSGVEKIDVWCIAKTT